MSDLPQIQKDGKNKILGPKKKMEKWTSRKCVALMMKAGWSEHKDSE